MKKLISATVLVTGFLVSGGAWANSTPKTNQDYLAACNKDHPLFLYCAGTITAIAGMMADPFFTKEMVRVCFTDGVTTGQRIQVYIKWAKENPKLWHEGGGAGMVVAMLETWPCPK